MQVDGVSNGLKIGWQNVKETAETEEGQEQQETAETENVEGEQSEQTDAQGVLRLLQEGHFKGVADVRLRINFHDELAAMEAEAVQATSGEKISGITEDIGGVVNSFVEGNEMTEEQSAAIQAAQNNFAAAVNAAGTNPAADLTAAFDEFIAALQNLFAQAGSETPPEQPIPPEEQPTPPEGGGEEPPIEEEGGQAEMTLTTVEEETAVNWQGFIESLRATFAAGMQGLTDAISGVSILPPLSEPEGKGGAYEKFLAIYNQMNGIEPTGEGLDETEPT
jgi:hypothetical protein